MNVRQDKFKFPTIETKRLTLRLLTLEDTRAVFELFSDENVTRFMEIDPCRDIEEAEEIIRFHIEDSGCRWGIFEKNGNQLIGTCGFHYWDQGKSKAEIGYDLAKAYWGRGLMTEVLREIVKIGFDIMDLIKIKATVRVENYRSVNLLRKLKFKRELVLRKGLVRFYIDK